MGNDHDLLIRIDANLSSLCGKVEVLGGKLETVDGEVGGHEVKLGELSQRVRGIEKRPSPIKWIVVMVALMELINIGAMAWFR